jgi:hypothetical protein
MNRRRATRGERKALILFIGLVIALSYRPGHPWDGLVGGVIAIVVLGRTLWTLSQMHDAERRDADE